MESTQQHSIRLPESTQLRLEELRSHVRKIKVAEGIFAGLFGLAVSYLIVFSLDRFIDTPALVRAISLVVGTLGFGVVLPWKCHRWIWGTRRMEQVARLVKQKYPRLGDQLLGVVELARVEQQSQNGSTLARAAIAQVDSVVKDRDLSDAVPNPRHRFWAGTAGIPMALMLLAILLVPAAGKNALARWLLPWQDVDRYTFTQIEPLPESMVVPHGEDFTISALLTDATKWRPEQGSARLSGPQQPIVTSLDEGAYNFHIPPQTDQFSLYVSIGDVKETIQIQTATRPELESMQATIDLPDYLQYTHPLSRDVRGGIISVLKNSSVRFEASINRALQSASLQGYDSSISGNQITTQTIPVAETELLKFHWKDELGLSSKDAFQLKINPVEDAAPSISMRQTEPMQVILSTDVIRLEIQTDDDFGLKQVGLEWEGVADPLRNPFPDTGEKIVVRGAPEKRDLQAIATFSAESDQVRPQTIRLRAYAEDYHPTRGRAYSSVVLLHVMTPAEHAIWMTHQLKRWASLADDVYEEEVRLHDENREIRRMDSKQLQLPNTQRRIEQQAASERANAARLGAVTDQGDRLIKQALRNPEMLVGHLDTWAEVLKQLRAISEDKMPSVADLLAQAARSVPKSGQGKPGSGKSGKTAGNNRSNKTGKGAKESKSKAPTKAAPKLVDIESGFNKIPEAKPGDQKKKKPSKGSLKLPTTVLQGGPPPGDDKKKKEEDKEENPVDEAVEEQEDLLEEFAKLREDMQAILDDLENSTFVKRLKGASRRQLGVATDLNRTLFKGFGVKEQALDERQTARMGKIAESEVAQSRNLYNIQSDLEAYYGRKRENKLLKILEELEKTEAVYKLNSLSERINANLSGESIARAEFWADTFDRWAEEMVSPSKCGACKGCKGASLPPSIVLEVMRILEGEMDLRDETRSLEQVKAAIKQDEFEEKADLQATTQKDLVTRTGNVLKDIRALPEGEKKFGKELQFIGLAKDAMQDAFVILSRPSTGPAAIAAETEAIELLLQSKRVNPKGGGGGGGSTPGGGGGGDTNQSALALHGPGTDPNAFIEDRSVEQLSGVASEQLPEEFRDGLDAFFNALDQRN